MKTVKINLQKNQFNNLSLHACSQLANLSWPLHRVGRLSASICKEMFYTDHTQKRTKQMQYGSTMEQKQQHVN